MIKTQNLTKIFRTEEVETVALNGVSINVEDGKGCVLEIPAKKILAQSHS
jgi:ABC-type multidrug transport system ATPase subunit